MRFNWGTGIFIFFTVFLILAFTFIVFSFKQNNDLVTDDYYEQGADYSTHIEIMKRSHTYSDSFELATSPNELILISANSLVKMADSLFVHFYHPASESKDYKFLVNDLVDTLTIPGNKLAHGRYIVKLDWQIDGEKYHIEKDLFID